MLNRRTLLCGLLGCIPLLGMKKNKDNIGFILFLPNIRLKYRCGEKYLPNLPTYNTTVFHSISPIIKCLKIVERESGRIDILCVEGCVILWYYDISFTDFAIPTKEYVKIYEN